MVLRSLVKRRQARVRAGLRGLPLAGGATIALAALATPSATVLGHFAKPLEARFQRPPIGDGGSLTGVIVLGGTEERLREAGRLARSLGHLRVFISGAGERDYVSRILGRDIVPERIELENRSRSTFENALETRKHIQPVVGERWLLITSASHMPRSMGAFRRVGFNLEPWPVYDLRDDKVLERAGAARHEWLGLVYYWIRGRSAALLPGPNAAAQ